MGRLLAISLIAFNRSEGLYQRTFASISKGGSQKEKMVPNLRTWNEVDCPCWTESSFFKNRFPCVSDESQYGFPIQENSLPKQKPYRDEITELERVKNSRSNLDTGSQRVLEVNIEV